MCFRNAGGQGSLVAHAMQISNKIESGGNQVRTGIHGIKFNSI